MVPNGPPEQSPKRPLQRLLDPGPDPAKLPALRNNPKLQALREALKALEPLPAEPTHCVGQTDVTTPPAIHPDPEREAQQVKDFQALLYQDLDRAFGTKRDIDAFCCFTENIHDLLRARDRLEALKVALTRYPAEVALIYPHVHQTLCHSQPGDAEEFLQQVASLNFPDPTWRARCDLQLGLLYGLNAHHTEALELLDKSLLILRHADTSGNNWQFIVTGEASEDDRPESWKAFFGEEILAAELLIAKASTVAGDHTRAAEILCSLVHDSESLTQILPKESDRNGFLSAVCEDLEFLCRTLGGKIEEPVAFNETLPPDAPGKILSDIYYELYTCYLTFERPMEAANARARHELFWSALGQTSPFLDD